MEAYKDIKSTSEWDAYPVRGPEYPPPPPYNSS